jgi:Holliday junction resolvase RusA-like endonuclease
VTLPFPMSLDPLLLVDIPGDPVGQGSLTTYPSGGIAYPKRTVQHRNSTVELLRTAWRGRPPLDQAVQVTIRFTLTRPAGHYLPANSRRPRPVLRDAAPSWCTKFPDVDKGARLILDALKIAGVYKDDKLCADLRASKCWGATGSTRVTMNPLPKDAG